MDTVRMTYGMAKVFEEQQLRLNEKDIEAEIKDVQQESVQEQTELDAERLREQVIESLKVKKQI